MLDVAAPKAADAEDAIVSPVNSALCFRTSARS
jgi:hypothetical protein